jgi:hypothetical protein
MNAQARRPRGLTAVTNQRAASARALILACRASTCQWDILGSAVYIGQSRTGRRIWVHRIRCVRCGSIRIAHYPPGRTLTSDRIGGYRYERPTGWSDVTVYYGYALQALVDEGAITVSDEPVPDDA